MAKTIKTWAESRYVVTMTEAGTVKGLYNGQEIVLVTLDKPGQADFTAISEQTLVSDDAAIVIRTRSGAGGSGASADVVGTMIENALHSETTDIPTPKGTDDCSYVYADIPAKYVPAGKLQSIALRGTDPAGNGYASPAYLVVWQEQAPGTDNFQPVAVSTNAVIQQAGALNEWLFDSPQMLNERIRFYLSDSPTLEAGFNWEDRKYLRSRVIPTQRWQDGHLFTPSTLNLLPELVIRMELPSDKFAPMSHATDTSMHLSSEERVGLSALLARKDDILALIPSTAELADDEPVAVGGEQTGVPVATGEETRSNEHTYESEL